MAILGKRHHNPLFIKPYHYSLVPHPFPFFILPHHPSFQTKISNSQKWRLPPPPPPPPPPISLIVSFILLLYHPNLCAEIDICDILIKVSDTDWAYIYIYIFIYGYNLDMWFPWSKMHRLDVFALPLGHFFTTAWTFLHRLDSLKLEYKSSLSIMFCLLYSCF